MRFGTTTGVVELDWPAVVRRQHAIVEEFQPLPAALARAGAEVVLGEARFSDPHTIAVNGSALWGNRIIISFPSSRRASSSWARGSSVWRWRARSAISAPM